ncbi:unnamed protein product [Linum trigynum]|uniref:Transcription factor MYB39 n=1 Tax=Linum trigynum TaxID=586398 RepID=A0AAV2DHP4_9ROSI
MGRSPCCDENGLKKGPWTTEEDKKLVDFIQAHGHGSWRALPKLAGLNRCGKSCRLRWTNYLKPDIKRGKFSQDEEQTILNLHSFLGNKWSAIASHLPGRTDNEIKNFWNTHLKKKLIQMGFDPMTHQPRTDLFATLPQLMALVQLKDLLLDHNNNNPLDHQTTRLQAEALQLAKLQYVQYLLQSSSTSSLSNHQNGVVSSAAAADIELINLLNSLPNQQLLHHHHHQFNNSQFGNMITTSTTSPMAATQPLHHHNHILLPPLCDPQEEEEVHFLTQTTTTTTTATTMANGNDCNNNDINNNNNTNHNNNNEMMNSWPVEVLPSPPPSSLPQTSTSNPTAGGGEGTSSSSSSYAGGVTSYNWTELFLDEPILSEISL